MLLRVSVGMKKMMIINRIHSVFSWLLPHTCILCANKSKRHQDLCLACEKKLPFIINGCRYCGKPLSENIKICGQCLSNKQPFSATFALFSYEEPIAKLITDLKFHQQLVNAKILGELMVKYLKFCSKPELIIPVPLHQKRLQERGFNQSLEIARYIAKKTIIPLDYKNCVRVKHTKAQASIPANKRAKNVKNAFQIKTIIRAKHVVIVDDVVTTGSTVSELSKTLLQSGIERVDIWCCARTK